MKSSPSFVSGFTLGEMLVVVTVAGILATLALPSFTSLTQSQRVRNAGFELYSSLTLARSEAIKRNSNVTITPLYCQVTSPTTHNETGWVISWVNGAILTPIHNEPQLKGIALTPNPVNTPVNTQCNPASNPNTPWLTYQGNGRTTAAVTPTFLIDAYGVATPTPNASCIKIELSGMPRVYKPSGGAC